MPIYAQKQDMLNRYDETALIELTDRAVPATGEINDVVLNAALSDADGVIDSYVSARYTVPLSPVPQVLTRHAAAIAWFILHRDRYPDEVRKAYDDAISFLRSLASGTAKLDVGGSEPASTAAIAKVDASERVFNRSNLGDY